MGILKDQPEKTENLNIDRSWSKRRKKKCGFDEKMHMPEFYQIKSRRIQF